MKFIDALISAFFVLVIAFPATAAEIKTVNIGSAVVVYNYQLSEEGGVTLTLNAQVPETNNSLRGLKNTDQRRLSKLGELIYQCKLLLYNPRKSDGRVDEKSPILVSQNYSLFTGVDMQLAANERIGIQAQTMQIVDDNSLFTPSLGGKDIHRKIWENSIAGVAMNLKQLNVNLLSETDVIGTAESLDIIVRFPVFQLNRPVSQWSYNFNLKDFRQAVRHANENCTSARFIELINQLS
jgi:hypothetical protein